MQNALNPLASMYQTQLEASRRCADAIFSGTEKIDRVMIGATHRVVSEQLRFAQEMATVRDPRNLGAALQSSFLSRNSGEAANYQKELMSIYAEMQSEIGRSWQDYIEQLGTQASTAPTAPANTQEQAGSPVFNPVTSIFSVWESAFKEVAALAKKNMATTQSAAEETAGRTMESAANYTESAAGATEEKDAYTPGAVGSADTDDKRSGRRK